MRRRSLFWLIGAGIGGLVLLAFVAVPLDPDFCDRRCPICTRARQGNRLARFFQAFEMFVTFGGCPWGRARQKKYGVPPNEPLPLTPPGDSTLPTIDRLAARN